MTLKEKIETRTARIGIIGLGYVGLPLAVEFGKAGFRVVGFDVDGKKVDQILHGVSYIPDVMKADVRDLVLADKLTATTHFGLIGDMDAVIICVPTPLKKTKDPDIQFIVAACESIAQYMHRDLFVSLESSTYPGTTDELMLPMLSVNGLEVGKDFFLCFSPERVDPGNPDFQTRNIPKVVGGITPACTEIGNLLYSCAVETVVAVQGTRTAEMVKLLENTFRMINIGLVNELAVMCDKMAINIWDVIDAAKTKPFGFMPFYPGPGLGGHCIPIDPFYFSWKAKQYGLESRFIETAGHINGQMPHYVVQKIQDALNTQHKCLNGSHVHISGVAYKRDIDDVRESPALDVAHLLDSKGAHLSYYDPFIPTIRIGSFDIDSVERLRPNGEDVEDWLGETYAEADCVVIITDHSDIDYKLLLERSNLVVDTRNVLKGLTDPKIVRL
jgi:UDP-N-acetyl-D-glucosamine dehydrogenase